MGLFRRKKETNTLKEKELELENETHSASSLPDSDKLPTVHTIVSHLKLLEAFYTLRESIENNEGVFGIKSGLAIPAKDGSEIPDNEAAVKEKRWAVYVQQAADRFEEWWDSAIKSEYYSMSARFDDVEFDPPNEPFPSYMLPPLDILMVWHAYMLNPVSYAEDCAVFKLQKVRNLMFPWAAIDLAITQAEKSGSSFYYDPGEKARQYFDNQCGALNWNLLDDPPVKMLKCSGCTYNVTVPYVTFSKTRNKCDEYTLLGTGYAEPGFEFECMRCHNMLNQSSLKATRFHRACTDIIEDRKDRAFVMGLFDHTGRQREYPVNLIKQNSLMLSMPLGNLEQAVELLNALIKVRPKTSDERKTYRKDRFDLRKFMRAYHETCSSFSLDLAAAVIRQGVFVQKMHKIGWYRAPERDETVAKLLQKYTRFFAMMKTNPRRTVVPTLDIDLAWHTHQLTPMLYYQYSFSQTSKFIDHDDKIDEGNLSRHFEWTCKEYERMFKEVYSECLCWYCELVRERNRSLFSSSKPSVSFYEKLKDDTVLDALTDIERTPHISAHNAVRSPFVKSKSTEKRMKRDYIAAFKRAQENNRPTPVPPTSGDHQHDRDQDQYRTHQDLKYLDLAPFAIAPFMFAPLVIPELYATDPGCVSAACAGGEFYSESGIVNPSVPGCANASCAGLSGGGGGGGGCGGHHHHHSACGGGGGGCGGGGGGCGSTN